MIASQEMPFDLDDEKQCEIEENVEHAPEMEEEEDVSDRIATQNSKLYSIYLKLGISYYRALLNFKLGDDDFPQIEFGDIIKKSDTDLGSDAFVEAEGENCN